MPELGVGLRTNFSAAFQVLFTATMFVGPMVKPGKYSEKINHYNVLRTIEDMYGLRHLGSSASAAAIKDVWQ